jgi:predicted DNA-binding transcriptional regulator YafY
VDIDLDRDYDTAGKSLALIRAIKIARLLEARPITYAVLERLCGSRRTVMRDLRRLRDAGEPVRYDAIRGLYYLDKS